MAYPSHPSRFCVQAFRPLRGHWRVRRCVPSSFACAVWHASLMPSVTRPVGPGVEAPASRACVSASNGVC
eukprot:6671669-Pyramimonas_sp.AAC.1